MPTTSAESAGSFCVGVASFLFERPVGLALGGEDMGVVGKAVQQGSNEFLVREHRNPFAEGKVCGHQRGASLIADTDEVEQKLATGAVKGDEAQLLDDERLNASHALVQPVEHAVATGLKQLF